MNKYTKTFYRNKKEEAYKPNGHPQSEQKKGSISYFHEWIEYVKVCKNCNSEILDYNWDYTKVKTEVSCDGCGSISIFPRGILSAKNKDSFTFEKPDINDTEKYNNKTEKIKMSFMTKNQESNTPTKVKKTPEQKFQEKNDRLEANITKKDNAIKNVETKRDEAIVKANEKIALIEKSKEVIELELFRHGRSKK